MNNRQLFLCFVIMLISSLTTFGQSYIIQFDSNSSAEEYFTSNRNDFLDIQLIGRSTNIYNIYPKSEASIDAIANHQSVLHFRKNVEVQSREVPNDSRYNEQWPLPLIDAEMAWEEVTHGETHDGREIVIAVIDNSFQISHPDLTNNIWTNDAEIPGDFIDNDDNGYVDDYKGLSVKQGNDNHPLGIHGTKVSGIIGAEGNNNLGIAGVNWKIKLMIISGADNSADIIEGYNYVLDQRRLYNQTNGAEGAFVVATNLSAGSSYQFGSSFPMWCGMYDKLGEAGIINITATDNSDYNVDEEGDMPTTCESQYLLTVTSTDRFDRKVIESAFGPIYVDLGAPGDETFSTTNGDGYDTFTGTSAASPHVAGAVGLLYAANCPQLISNSLQFPASAALTIKEAILNSVTSLPDLVGRSVSGGRLNIFAAMGELAMLCNEEPSSLTELKITSLGPNPLKDYLQFKYEFMAPIDHTVSVYNSTGNLMYHEIIKPSLFETPTHVLELSELRRGMYILTMEDGTSVSSMKFFKE